MNRIIFIIPYFGKLPKYFHVWKETVFNNPKFDFLLITDNERILSERNLMVKHMNFTEIRKLFENKLGMRISLDTPYKLCDFKPAYGFLFQEYISEYEFWGHCDMDIIFGQLDYAITDEVLNNYDKILEHGHLACYRNTEYINSIFKNQGPYPEYNYEKVFRSPESFYFDEWYGMMLKCRRLRINTWNSDRSFLDINTKIREFHHTFGDDSERQKCTMHYQGGRLYVNYGDVQKEKQIIYAHFQKRIIDFNQMNSINRSKEYMIIPNMAAEEKLPKEAEIIRIIKNGLYIIKVKLRHVDNFIERYKQAKPIYHNILNYYKSRQGLKKRRIAQQQAIEFYENNEADIR